MDVPETPAPAAIPAQVVRLQQDFLKHCPAVLLVTVERLVTADQKVLGVLEVMEVTAVRSGKVALPNPLLMVLRVTVGQVIEMGPLADRAHHLRL